MEGTEFYCRDLLGCSDGTRINSCYRLSKKAGLRTYGQGWMFNGELSDITGRVNLVYFGTDDESQTRELYGSLILDNVVQVFGELSTYNNQKQIVIDGKTGADFIRLASRDEYDITKFLPNTNQDPELLWEYLLKLINSIQDPHLKTLLETIFRDTEIASLFKTVPGARVYHHACKGGLLEHVWETTQYCELACMIHPSMDRDLIITGAILHDIGKIKQNIITGSITETREGMLLGHIHLGITIIKEKISEIPDFPEMLETKLLHILLSHHGEYGQGSEITPMMPEAITVASADVIGSKVTQYIRVRKDTDETGFKTWRRPIGWVFTE